ncbi:MAG: single-stranded-DNA-specific exonuclease RecJ [Patescibacteria group bacterium]|nr:single-stranded-DNA-specific exonuclease RecJ [Patescibacteria group bacterium]
MKEKRWVVAPRVKEDLIEQLLYNRQITDEVEKNKFFNPSLDPQPLISKDQLKKAIKRIRQAVEGKEPIVVYGDFDVDGVTSTALLWETLNKFGAKVTPYIPHREKEGYGLSEGAIKEIAEKRVKLIITVDCGINAVSEVALANSLGIEVIVTDHHHRQEDLPEALAILHTTDLAGVGVAYELSTAIFKEFGQIIPVEALDLVALGTVADMVPLLGKNRSLVKHGLKQLNQTTRFGLQAMMVEAGVKVGSLGTYEIGFMLAPRLNAMGRMEHAMDSLRLLLTTRKERAENLAQRLGETNAQRQRLTLETIDHARTIYADAEKGKKILVLSHEGWQQGVIGLVAGRLADELGRPVLAVSRGEELSKGSARSIGGFNIIDAICSCSDILVSHGGHPQAAGFTLETKNLAEFEKRLVSWAEDKLKDEDLTPLLKVEAEVTPDQISFETIRQLRQFEPFGMGNPEPIFLGRGFEVKDFRTVGSDGKHLKLRLGAEVMGAWKRQGVYEAIGFGLGEWKLKLRPGMKVDVAFVLEEDNWNGNKKLQLKVKDLKLAHN